MKCFESPAGRKNPMVWHKRQSIRDFITGESRSFDLETEVLHVGEYGITDNRQMLKSLGVWGNPEKWTYVGASLVTLSGGHRKDAAIVCHDEDEMNSGITNTDFSLP